MNRNLVLVVGFVLAIAVLGFAAFKGSMKMIKDKEQPEQTEQAGEAYTDIFSGDREFVSVDLRPDTATESTERDAERKDYLVSWVYKYRWGAETSGIVRVSQAWYKTEGDAFLNLIISRLIEVGVIPQDNDLGNPAKEALTLTAMTPIPQSMVVTTAGPDWQPAGD